MLNASRRMPVPFLLLFMLMSLALLNGCSSTRRDGPPNFYVDENKVPNATPRAEPLSKYGNYVSYNVRGKRYYVLRSSRNYHERGVASWYGTMFHSQKTSSGERYDMLAMTAAHKTLPLPTYVEVTNLSNHRKIIVKVNDRGPFKQDRIIDLSYVAAKKLGMLGRGTAYVEIKSVDPRDAAAHPELLAKQKHYHFPPAPQITALRSHTALYLQVGSFHKRAQAEKLKHRLVLIMSSPVYVNPIKKMYYVHVGPIKDAATAQRLAKKLKAHGLRGERVNLREFDIT